MKSNFTLEATAHSTGIVRRIDDLGRVVIPKEIRRTCGIHEGDPLEIFVNGKQISMRKWQPSDDDFAQKCAGIASNHMHLVRGMVAMNDATTIFTDRGKATVKRYYQDKYDANVAIVYALAKLGYCRIPERSEW